MNSDTVKKLLMKIKAAERALEKKLEMLEESLSFKIKTNTDSIDELRLKFKQQSEEIKGVEEQMELQ